LFYCCSVTVVESIPENLNYTAGSPSHLSTYDAWMQLIGKATKTIDIVAFYWTMRSSDTGHEEPSAQQVNKIDCRYIITCKRGSAKHSIKDDHALLWKHAIFRHLPCRNHSTDQNENLHD
jgi:hypothetical protein